MKVITYFSIIQYVVQPNSFEQVPSILLLHSEERKANLTSNKTSRVVASTATFTFLCLLLRVGTSVFYIRCTWYRVLIIINTKAIIIDSQNWMLHCLIIIGFRLILQWCSKVFVYCWKVTKQFLTATKQMIIKGLRGYDIQYTTVCKKKKRWML